MRIRRAQRVRRPQGRAAGQGSRYTARAAALIEGVPPAHPMLRLVTPMAHVFTSGFAAEALPKLAGLFDDPDP